MLASVGDDDGVPRLAALAASSPEMMTSYECGVKGARAGHSTNSSHAFQPGYAGSI